MPHEFRPLRIGIGPADESEIEGMYSIFGHAFRRETPELAEVLYAGKNTYPAFTDFVNKNLYSEQNEFMIAFDTREEFDREMCYGWISIGTVPHPSRLSSYTAGDFSVNISLKMLATEARARGENPLQLNANDPRVRLATELGNQSRDSQNRFVLYPHLVVNSLVLWPNSHSDSKREMASKLLGWAIGYAETPLANLDTSSRGPNPLFQSSRLHRSEKIRTEPEPLCTFKRHRFGDPGVGADGVLVFPDRGVQGVQAPRRPRIGGR